MDTKTVIMFGAAAASLWALQQIKDTQKNNKLLLTPSVSGKESADNSQYTYMLTRIADAYAQAAERETDPLSKLSHWQAAKHAVWTARVLFNAEGDQQLDGKYTAYSDMEAGMQNQIREVMASAATTPAAAAAADFVQQPAAAEPQPAAPSSFFPSSPFESPQNDSTDKLPDALSPIETKTSKGGGDMDRVQPYAAEM